MFVINEHFIKGTVAALANMPKEANPYRFEGQPLAMWNAGHDYITLDRNEAELNAEPLKLADKEPEDQGRVAYQSSRKLEDNPYGFGDPHGTAEEVATNAAHTAWDKGWRLEHDESVAMFERPDEATLERVWDNVQRQIEPEPIGFLPERAKLVAVPVINQYGTQVGTASVAIDRVEGHVDSSGTTWLPATAWAYMAACRALRHTQDSLREQCAAHDKRVNELLAANSDLVVRAREADAKIADWERRLTDDHK